MQIPIVFPDPLEEAYRRAQEFQRLSPDERWRQIIGMMALGWEMVRSSPRRKQIEERFAEHEAEWRRIQQELFARYSG
jgi:hypothetical protein